MTRPLLPRDLLNIIIMYAAPDDDELIIRWLCKGNKYYEEGNEHRLVGLCSASVIVENHKSIERFCDECDLTKENVYSEKPPYVCVMYKQRRERLPGVGGGPVRSYSIRKMIKFLQKQKPNCPLNPGRNFRNVKNLIRLDARNFCSAERGRWVADFWAVAESEE